MRHISIVLILCFGVVSVIAQNRTLSVKSLATKKINVEVNSNVELLGFAYFLGYLGKEIDKRDSTFEINHSRTTGKEWYAFGWHIYQEYRPYNGSKNITAIVSLADKIWLDYLINLLLQLDDCPNARLKKEIDPRYYIRFSERGNIKEAEANATSFIRALNELHKEIKFNNYLKKYKSYYKIVINDVEKRLPDKTFIPAMEDFYGAKFDAYQLIPSLTIPTSMGFGLKVKKDDRIIINNVFGPLWFQNLSDNKMPDLGFKDERRIRELSIHEFGHSFVNPVLDNIPQTLIKETAILFDKIKAPMQDQGYGQWKICLYEHFVRAGEIIISRNLGYKDEADKLLKQYIEVRKFIYLPIILEELEKYNARSDGHYKQNVINALNNLSKTKL